MVRSLAKHISCCPWNVTQKLNFRLGESSNVHTRKIVATERCCKAFRIGHIVNGESNKIDVHNAGIRKHQLAKLDEQRTSKMRPKRGCHFRIQSLVKGVTVKNSIGHHGRSTNDTSSWGPCGGGQGKLW